MTRRRTGWLGLGLFLVAFGLMQAATHQLVAGHNLAVYLLGIGVWLSYVSGHVLWAAVSGDL